jgi:hypothetical protein
VEFIDGVIFWIFMVANIGTSIASVVGLTREWDATCNVGLRDYNVVSIVIITFLPLVFEVYRRSMRINSQNADQHKGFRNLKYLLWITCVGVVIWGWVIYSRIDDTCISYMLMKTTLAFLIVNSVYNALPLLILLLLCICFPCFIVFASYIDLPSNNGLDQAIIDSMNTYEYKPNGLAQAVIDQDSGQRIDEINIGTEDRACCICLMPYEENALLRCLPCKHHMHKSCCDEWLKMNNSCPICRTAAVSDEQQELPV